MFKARQVLAILWLIFLAASMSWSQVTNVTDDTSVPIPGVGHNYIEGFNDAVNPANGSISLRIQLPAPKGRELTVPFSINYDSDGAFAVLQGQWTGQPAIVSQGGWSYSFPLLTNTYHTKTITEGERYLVRAFRGR